MSKKRLLRLLSMLFAFSLVAAACGGSSSDAEGTDDTTETDGDGSTGGAIDLDELEEDEDEEVTSTTAEEEPAAEPTNMEELEAAWAADRQAVLDRINEEGLGLADGIVTGPGGFTMDTSTCPADWSDTEGLTDDTILYGATIAQSGNLASYGNIKAGMESYFKYVNENGGIDGRNIVMIAKDDGYVATQTIELVDQLLQADKPFMITTLGSPNTFAVYDVLNEKCVPQPFVMTGHPAWGDPENHPWTWGDQMSYSTEAILWGSWIETNMADRLPVKVAGLVMENDFGLSYEGGMKAFAEANPDIISEFVAVRHEAAAPTVTNEMTTIAAEQPDVFIAMTAGNPCLLAVQEAARAGLVGGDTVNFMPSVCKDPNAFMIPAGDAAEGWNIVGGGLKTTTDPQYVDEVFIKFLNERLEADGLDITVGLYATGFGLFAWPVVETLRIAAEMEGGLTRTNFVIAARAFQGDHPLALEGIEFGMNGNEDAFPIEGSDFAVYDSAAASWIQEGDVIDLNGSSGLCAWDKAAATC